MAPTERGRSGRAGRPLGRTVRELGLAVITLGPGGGAAVEPGGNITRVPGFPTKVVDTVGAGDTFMAGFLDGYVKLQLGMKALWNEARPPPQSSAPDVARSRRQKRQRWTI